MRTKSSEIHDLTVCFIFIAADLPLRIYSIAFLKILCCNACQAAQAEQAAQTEEVAAEENGAVDERFDADSVNVFRAYTLMAHKSNYILLGSNNSAGYLAAHFREQYGRPNIELDDTEVKFQLSIKMPLAVGLFNNHMDIFTAYTNCSFRQLYNDDISSPFRETNHEPEAWFQFRNDWVLFRIKNRVNQFGFVQQSNGRGGVLSRSWNRLFANFVLNYKDFGLSIKPWYRLPENDDDNPDITDYLGHYELTGVLKWDDHTFSLMRHNKLESNFEKGAVQGTWSFPLWGVSISERIFSMFQRLWRKPD